MIFSGKLRETYNITKTITKTPSINAFRNDFINFHKLKPAKGSSSPNLRKPYVNRFFKSQFLQKPAARKALQHSRITHRLK